MQEKMRTFAEGARITNEVLRQVQESARQTAENLRYRAEETCQAAEELRLQAKQAVEVFRQVTQDQAQLLAEMQRTLHLIRQLEPWRNTPEDEQPSG
jgi:hypothetical protein